MFNIINDPKEFIMESVRNDIYKYGYIIKLYSEDESIKTLDIIEKLCPSDNHLILYCDMCEDICEEDAIYFNIFTENYIGIIESLSNNNIHSNIGFDLKDNMIAKWHDHIIKNIF
jgi:ferredoxin